MAPQKNWPKEQGTAAEILMGVKVLQFVEVHRRQGRIF